VNGREQCSAQAIRVRRFAMNGHIDNSPALIIKAGQEDDIMNSEVGVHVEGAACAQVATIVMPEFDFAA
jgi:hypothetical protein